MHYQDSEAESEIFRLQPSNLTLHLRQNVLDWDREARNRISSYLELCVGLWKKRYRKSKSNFLAFLSNQSFGVSSNDFSHPITLYDFKNGDRDLADRLQFCIHGEKIVKKRKGFKIKAFLSIFCAIKVPLQTTEKITS